MPVKSEKAYSRVRVRSNLARRLRRIAFANHRRGIQTETELAILDYCQKHEALLNRKDNGK